MKLQIAGCVAALSLSIFATGTCADPLAEALIVAAHNKYRSEVGAPSLHWSAELAANAQQWADHLAVLRQLKHSGTPGVGENLAFGTEGHMSLTQLIDLWANERQRFQDGPFPSVSVNGDWQSVGHYTQMVWKGTTEVGCGVASGGGNEYLVCQYSPQGNVAGEKAY